MSLILRKDVGRKLTIAEIDGNFEYLDNKIGGGSGATGPQGPQGPQGPGSVVNDLINDTITIEIPLDPTSIITAVDYTQKLTRLVTGTFTGFYSNTFSDPIEMGPGECITQQTKSYKGQFDYNFQSGYGYYNTSPMKTNFDYTIGTLNFNDLEAVSTFHLCGYDTQVGGLGCFGVCYIAERQCYGCDQPIGRHVVNFNNSPGLVNCGGCGCSYWCGSNDSGAEICGDGCLVNTWGCFSCCGCGCCPPKG